MRPEPFQATTIVRRFHRGHERPRGVAWFGIRSFWGHMQHLIASAIATEDVDSRDWMTPDEPRALSERIARLLGGTTAAAGTGSVTERLGRDLWVDYLADTGDDVTVSRAVARFVFQPYELPDPVHPGQHLPTPRGDVLLFGGDTAYPVATAEEIRNRVIAPFNQVLSEREDGKRRVLLGIPGNHDWYDGLDGFGRMFRRHVDYDDAGKARPTLHGSSRTLLGHYAEWAVEFVRGGSVEKPSTLDLVGYTAVQSASYFALPVAPGIALLAVDRQLKRVDSRQRLFFGRWLNQHLAVAPWVLLPDPVCKFGLPSPTGVESIKSLGLTLTARPHFVLSGDIHHYRRENEGPTLHVTAGGGGAFLHPAAIARGGRPPVVEWPGVRQSRALLWQVPWKVALGRSGFLPHLGIAGLLLPLAFGSGTPSPLQAIPSVVVVTLVLALIGGVRGGRIGVLFLSMLTALLLVGGAVAVRLTVEREFSIAALHWASKAAALTGASVLGAFLFGAYLALLTRLGYENTQAFTALDHPGFKHFVRLRVRADGSAIDGWCIGCPDPVSGRDPVLVDTFTWNCR